MINNYERLVIGPKNIDWSLVINQVSWSALAHLRLKNKDKQNEKNHKSSIEYS